MKNLLFSLLLIGLFGQFSQAQCVIAITNITDNFQNGGDVVVEGTASCDVVEVILSCNGNQISETAATTNGNWQVVFTPQRIAELECECGSTIRVEASCKGEPCNNVSRFILCGDNGTCPIVSIAAGPVSCLERNANGDFDIDFTINANGGQFTAFYYVTFGDGTNQTYTQVGTNPLTISHTYVCPTASPQTYYVDVLAVGCSSDPNYSSSDQVSIQFPDCGCPTLSAISTNISNSDPCEVTFDLNVTGCTPAGMQYVWTFGDGNNSTTNTGQETHSYGQNGQYPVSVCLTGFGATCCQNTTVDISGCICAFPPGTSCDDGDPNTVNDEYDSNCNCVGTPDDDDDCSFCICGVGSWWCCLLYVLFILALISLALSLLYALCQQNTAAWVWFGISLAVVLALAAVLIWVCDLSICEFLIAAGSAGAVNWIVVCNTNILIPPACKSWLCQMTTIPILGFSMTNHLIINILLWLLTLLFCTVF